MNECERIRRFAINLAGDLQGGITRRLKSRVGQSWKPREGRAGGGEGGGRRPEWMNEPIRITCLCAHERGEQQSGKQMAHRARRIIYRLLGHAIIVKRVISRNKRAHACPITASDSRERGEAAGDPAPIANPLNPLHSYAFYGTNWNN